MATKPRTKKAVPGAAASSKKQPPKTEPAKQSLDLKLLKEVSLSDLIEIYKLVLNNTTGTLRAVVKDEATPAITAMVVSVVLRIIGSGDMKTFDAFLDRLVGRIKEEGGLPQGMGPASSVKINVFIPSNGREANMSSGG